MPIIAVANQKGGVGKTSLVANVGWLLSADHGRRVALVDFDPQGNLSMAFQHDGAGPSMAQWLFDPQGHPDQFAVALSPTLALFPADADLAGAEVALAQSPNRTGQLSRCLTPLAAQCDFVLVDCPPSLGILTVNALSAANAVLVPLQCSYWALQGLRQLLDVINRVRDRTNPQLALLGILLNQADLRTLHAREVVQGIRARFPQEALEAIIPRTVRFDDATVARQPLVVFTPHNRAAEAYRLATQELLARCTKLCRKEPSTDA